MSRGSPKKASQSLYVLVNITRAHVAPVLSTALATNVAYYFNNNSPFQESVYRNMLQSLSHLLLQKQTEKQEKINHLKTRTRLKTNL
jgi:hypothetical protein